jgi:hypothetical protein
MYVSIYTDVGLSAGNAKSKVGTFGSYPFKGEHHVSIAGKNTVVLGYDLTSDRMNLFGFAIVISTLANQLVNFGRSQAAYLGWSLGARKQAARNWQADFIIGTDGDDSGN